MIGDALDHLTQIALRLDAIQECGTDEAIHRWGSLTAGIRSTEQKIPAPERDRTNRSLAAELSMSARPSSQ
jgi:hypothetical protein